MNQKLWKQDESDQSYKYNYKSHKDIEDHVKCHQVKSQPNPECQKF